MPIIWFEAPESMIHNLREGNQDALLVHGITDVPNNITEELVLREALRSASSFLNCK